MKLDDLILKLMDIKNSGNPFVTGNAEVCISLEGNNTGIKLTGNVDHYEISNDVFIEVRPVPEIKELMGHPDNAPLKVNAIELEEKDENHQYFSHIRKGAFVPFEGDTKSLNAQIYLYENAELCVADGAHDETLFKVTFSKLGNIKTVLEG